MSERTRVILESPFRESSPGPKRGRNKRYLRRALRDSIFNHNESPFASHEMFTRALDDNEPHERQLGINLALPWLAAAEKMVVYADLMISTGMQQSIARAVELKIPIEYRYIDRREVKRGN